VERRSVNPVTRWQQERAEFDAGDYDARWEALKKAGRSVHGEADFVMSFEPATVLDAGCGTGRVAIELAARGVAVTGIDLDARMIEAARNKTADAVGDAASNPTWVLGDVSTFELREQFDVVVAPGNVMIFVEPGTEARSVACLAAHIAPGGHLISGFQLRAGGYDVASYDSHCAAARLTFVARYATWEGEPFADGDYAVSVHRT
jgi:2-polyprenyl-3-methyl-5-hydroxy-6-metoxy-1,4-benzoquinol methylase